MTTYSGNNPCEVSPECYKDIETSLETWYNSQENPFRNYFENGVRVGQQYIVDKFSLIIQDLDDSRIEVSLISKENPWYVPYYDEFHKELGTI